MPPSDRPVYVPATCYFPPALYKWMRNKVSEDLITWHDSGRQGERPSFTAQVITYCQQGWLRDQLDQAAALIETSPDALDTIRQHIEGDS